jgi:hypothetical protein
MFAISCLHQDMACFVSLVLGPCRDAVHTMLDADIAGAPVVNKAGQIIGVLTEADVIWKVGQCLFWPEGSCTSFAVLLLTSGIGTVPGASGFP